MRKESILIIDDEQSIRMNLAESLAEWGYAVDTAIDGTDALEKFRMDIYGAVITDIKMPGMNGLDVLRTIKKISAETPVIVITGFGTVNTAVEAMKEGASDFLMKPFSLEHLELVVKNVMTPSTGHMTKSGKDMQSYLSGGKTIITKNEKMMSLLEMLKNVAKSKSSILIQGGSGTGKELIARYIHNQSPRANMPFVAVNCAAIPYNLLESEMFGYEKGAFTGAQLKKPGKFELADHGTLLLDEVSEMELQLQAKLLRVIQESEIDRLGAQSPVPVDVRVIATTNADLKTRIAEGTFRGDLYYRLNVIPVKIPPLRARKDDIVLLGDYFLDKYSSLNGLPRPCLSQEAIAFMEQYDWPGNVRELENVIERSVLICGGNVVRPEHLCLDDMDDISTEIHRSYEEPDTTAVCGAKPLTLRESEKRLIFDTLKRVRGNKTKASEILGVSVRTIRNKLNEYKEEAPTLIG
jgi:DNA-binding NtrC family response regulator